MPVDELRERVRAGWLDFSAVSARQRVSEALALALEETSESDNICVAGSLAVVGEAMAAWERLSASPEETHQQAVAPEDRPVSTFEG
jgi:hypothetical protein